jgi:hypothetical protein
MAQKNPDSKTQFQLRSFYRAHTYSNVNLFLFLGHLLSIDIQLYTYSLNI